ncbi:huntingtin-interacting protein 1 isoform X3 [Pectinophora gossypiella]|nr:huntingtin-interacting protein 1 isoform X3 [Pectinophora gossypiella]
MASLSLPRVLQLKKNSLDAEREQFEKFQSLAINKAINSIETPVKEKHVRSTIIGTFQERSAVTYWMVAVRLPLQDNRIVAWKFCHVTHKLLREGHPACLDDSQRHIGMIENLGKLWVHLREGYGRLIHLYGSLLVTKLKFHARNPRFPGNMQLTVDELDAIAENDVNNYFQLCVELFDYMEDILNLQAAVFDSLGNARANSMTASGQCRLAALIPCAQDSSHIYDCNVRLLFRLHASLPADTLAGHRERFRQQFKKLSSFYKHASSLQYYRNLLTLPVLPSNPPNFLLQSDFGTYVTPVVSIPEPPPDEVDAVGSLIDTSDTISQATTPDHFETLDTRATPSPQPDPIVERDRLIDHLQNELKRMRSEVSQLVQERNTMLSSMREHCTRLESQLHSAKIEIEEEKQKAQLLSAETPEIKQKLTETEEKAKVTDEKFQKLKGAYTQLREEHIALIRQKAEVDKMSASLRAAAAQHESAKTALQQQLNDRMKDFELLQQSSSSSEEVEAYKSEIANLRSEIEQSRQKEVELETLRGSMEALEIEHKTATAEQQEKLTTVTNELKEVTENLEKIKQEKEERESELCRVKTELMGLREKSGEEYKRVVEEKEAALKQVSELTQQHQQEKEVQGHRINNLQLELETLRIKLIDSEKNLEIRCKKISDEFSQKNRELEEGLIRRETEIKDALEKMAQLESEIEVTKEKFEETVTEKDRKVANLQDKLNELILIKGINDTTLKEIEVEKEKVKVQLAEISNEKESLLKTLAEKESEISNLGNTIKELQTREQIQKTSFEEIDKNKTKEISELQERLQNVIQEKDSEINELRKILQDKTELQKSEGETLIKTISELKTSIIDKDKEIETLTSKLMETTDELEKQTTDLELLKKENELKITLLEDKLQTVTQCKDEIIDTLTGSIAEKDNQVITLNVEVNTLSADVARLEEELKETQAEMEIGKNELLTLREEHDRIVEINENNIALKNKELRSLNDEVEKLTRENAELISEKDKLTEEKQVLESKLKEVQGAYESKIQEYKSFQNEKTDAVNELNSVIEELKSEYEQLKDLKDTEIKRLHEKIQDSESKFSIQVCEKDETIAKAETNINQLKDKLETLQSEKTKEKEELNEVVDQKEKEMQDLLQHNSVLEADLAAAKKQLEETKMELLKQTSRLVSVAGSAALQVTDEALAALERGSASETNRAAAELAATALQDLAQTEVQGNEETVARSAIVAAHNTATLSAYATEVCNISTDMQLSDKLSNECRAMLQSTKQCLEALSTGSIPASACVEARGHVNIVAQTAAAADRLNSGARSVDDELADMDSAIEQAASQIEEMLKASRAGDSGVKLEVNEKILDACTTLMGAVKMLVQDARKLQNELGDPKTRQKMYRRNPQWSEGLISAAKAVVFAAKLLVSSADEAVGAAGRVEGVSAAAHEVAGSTAQLVAASRARAPPAAPALARLTRASRSVAAATGAVVAAVRAGSALQHDQEALDTSALTLTATRRLEMECKVRSLELESALDAERARLAALRKRHYHLAQQEENGNMTNGK